MGRKESDMTEQLSLTHTHIYHVLLWGSSKRRWLPDTQGALFKLQGQTDEKQNLWDFSGGSVAKPRNMSCHLFLISSASVRSIPFLSFIEPIFAWNVPLVSLNFLEEISSFSHSIIFLYFFALITEEGFLVYDELWTKVRDVVQETGSKTVPKKSRCKKAKWLSEETLQKAVKREAKRKEKRKDIPISMQSSKE